MQILKMIPLDKKKQKIYLEDDSVFALYNGEIRRFRLEEEGDVSRDTLQEIFLILRKRARERSFYLLKDSDKTEAQIRRKLKEGYYPPSVIEETLIFLREHRYVDDERYTRFFVEQMQGKKSRREISMKLMERGVSRDLIQLVLEETEVQEEEALYKLMEKKLRGKDLSDPKLRDKVFQHFYRKGYSPGQIEQIYRQCVENFDLSEEF